jgi:hypothetical protein
VSLQYQESRSVAKIISYGRRSSRPHGRRQKLTKLANNIQWHTLNPPLWLPSSVIDAIPCDDAMKAYIAEVALEKKRKEERLRQQAVHEENKRRDAIAQALRTANEAHLNATNAAKAALAVAAQAKIDAEAAAAAFLAGPDTTSTLITNPSTTSNVDGKDTSATTPTPTLATTTTTTDASVKDANYWQQRVAQLTREADEAAAEAKRTKVAVDAVNKPERKSRRQHYQEIIKLTVHSQVSRLKEIGIKDTTVRRIGALKTSQQRQFAIHAVLRPRQHSLHVEAARRGDPPPTDNSTSSDSSDDDSNSNDSSSDDTENEKDVDNNEKTDGGKVTEAGKELRRSSRMKRNVQSKAKSKAKAKAKSKSKAKSKPNKVKAKASRHKASDDDSDDTSDDNSDNDDEKESKTSNGNTKRQRTSSSSSSAGEGGSVSSSSLEWSSKHSLLLDIPAVVFDMVLTYSQPADLCIASSCTREWHTKLYSIRVWQRMYQSCIGSRLPQLSLPLKRALRNGDDELNEADRWRRLVCKEWTRYNREVTDRSRPEPISWYNTTPRAPDIWPIIHSGLDSPYFADKLVLPLIHRHMTREKWQALVIAPTYHWITETPASRFMKQAMRHGILVIDALTSLGVKITAKELFHLVENCDVTTLQIIASRSEYASTMHELRIKPLPLAEFGELIYRGHSKIVKDMILYCMELGMPVALAQFGGASLIDAPLYDAHDHIWRLFMDIDLLPVLLARPINWSPWEQSVLIHAALEATRRYSSVRVPHSRVELLNKPLVHESFIAQKANQDNEDMMTIFGMLIPHITSLDKLLKRIAREGIQHSSVSDQSSASKQSHLMI